MPVGMSYVTGAAKVFVEAVRNDYAFTPARSIRRHFNLTD
jgi:hypothetical protein